MVPCKTLNVRGDGAKTVLVVGRFMSGKFCLCNALAGLPHYTGDFFFSNDQIKELPYHMKMVQAHFSGNPTKRINILDVNGLEYPIKADDAAELSELLYKVKVGCDQVHLILFALSGHNPVLGPERKDILRLLLALFGAEMWKKMVFVFTRLSMSAENRATSDQLYKEGVNNFKEELEKHCCAGSSNASFVHVNSCRDSSNPEEEQAYQEGIHTIWTLLNQGGGSLWTTSLDMEKSKGEDSSQHQDTHSRQEACTSAITPRFLQQRLDSLSAQLVRALAGQDQMNKEQVKRIMDSVDKELQSEIEAFYCSPADCPPSGSKCEASNPSSPRQVSKFLEKVEESSVCVNSLMLKDVFVRNNMIGVVVNNVRHLQNFASETKNPELQSLQTDLLNIKDNDVSLGVSLKVFLNGEGDAKSKFVSLFLKICSGEDRSYTISFFMKPATAHEHVEKSVKVQGCKSQTTEVGVRQFIKKHELFDYLENNSIMFGVKVKACPQVGVL